MTLVKNTRLIVIKQLISPWENTPKGQRLYFAVSRWKRVIDQMYADVPEQSPFANAELRLDVHATVGTPFSFGTWYPRACLDVPPYTTIYFQNARVSSRAPKPRHLPTKHLLPKAIYFFVRTMTTQVDFPLPEDTYPCSKYLHIARVLPGHEAGGPAAHLNWSVDTVVGLKRHQCTKDGAPPSTMQLVIVVPSWVSRDGQQAVNEGVEPQQIAFSPTNYSQLHFSKRLPRVIVPLYPRTSLDQPDRRVDGKKSGERLLSLRQLLGAWKAFSSRELKVSAIRRWVKIVALLPKQVPYVPPAPQMGSPFMEQLRDLGIEKNRARWPRLERAKQLSSSFSKGGIRFQGRDVDGDARHASLKPDDATAQQLVADHPQPSGRHSSGTSIISQDAPQYQVAQRQGASPGARPRAGPAMQSARSSLPPPSARSLSPRRSTAEGAAARADASSAVLTAALNRQLGEDDAALLARTLSRSYSAPRAIERRGASPRPASPRASPMSALRGAARSSSPRCSRPGLDDQLDSPAPPTPHPSSWLPSPNDALFMDEQWTASNVEDAETRKVYQQGTYLTPTLSQPKPTSSPSERVLGASGRARALLAASGSPTVSV